jgi:hypothetical protein
VKGGAGGGGCGGICSIGSTMIAVASIEEGSQAWEHTDVLHPGYACACAQVQAHTQEYAQEKSYSTRKRTRTRTRAGIRASTHI